LLNEKIFVDSEYSKEDLKKANYFSWYKGVIETEIFHRKLLAGKTNKKATATK